MTAVNRRLQRKPPHIPFPWGMAFGWLAVIGGVLYFTVRVAMALAGA